MNMRGKEEKPIQVHPNSPMAKIILKMWEDKQLVQQYIREGRDLRDLKEKGIVIVDPL
jgi:hypothetical protein